jgi:transcriptional regulator with XRE-family HTH domain
MLKPGTANSARDLEIRQWDKEYNTGPYALIGKSTGDPDGWASWGLYYDHFREHSFRRIPVLPSDSHINVVMRHLRKHHGALVSPSDGPSKGEITGVIFPLYLNRFQVRSFFYYWILGLETRLVRYVGLMYPRDSDFQAKLAAVLPRERDEINRILRIRRNAGQTQARLSECLYLWQALRILNGDPTVEKIRWLASEPFEIDEQDEHSFTVQDLKDTTVRDLVDFRNSIMHPMSLLVTDDDASVAELVKKYVLVKKMAQIMDVRIRSLTR